MYYYTHDEKILASFDKYDFKEVDIDKAMISDKIYFLGKLPISKSRSSFVVTSQSELYEKCEDISLLKIIDSNYDIPDMIKYKIAQRKLIYINTNYPNWLTLLSSTAKRKYKINVVGLGDVGGTLLIGLRLLGSNLISSIGIYDRNEEKVKRWLYETNQIYHPFSYEEYPDVVALSEEQLFDCDVFVFCVSVGVPDLNEKRDVRMLQFEGNSKIISSYANLARKNNFKGVFAVVSDPVDLLCKVAFLESNKNETGQMDYNGLSTNQIIGFGLGVMNARAIFYSKLIEGAENYKTEGRVFGPHGQEIVVANSIENYNDDVSIKLTEKVKNANIDVRNLGFKPFIAPALSSGALSILSMLREDWFYGSTFIGGVYFGCKIRYLDGFIEVEGNCLPDVLFNRIQKAYHDLEVIV